MPEESTHAHSDLNKQNRESLLIKCAYFIHPSGMQIYNDTIKKKVWKKTLSVCNDNNKIEAHTRCKTFLKTINWFGSRHRSNGSVSHSLVCVRECALKADNVDYDYFYHVLYWTSFFSAQTLVGAIKWNGTILMHSQYECTLLALWPVIINALSRGTTSAHIYS